MSTGFSRPHLRVGHPWRSALLTSAVLGVFVGSLLAPIAGCAYVMQSVKSRAADAIMQCVEEQTLDCVSGSDDLAQCITAPILTCAGG